MSAKPRLKVVLCWHMHQPQYVNRLNGEFQLPWTYLHAIKDYTDMAAHLEANPKARAVVNFAPILLEQIDAYARQLKAFLSTGEQIRDPLLCALSSVVLPADLEQRIGLVKDCLRANKERLVNRFVPYRRLARMASWLIKNPYTHVYWNDQFLVDMLVWYHLAWMGESVRRSEPRVQALIKKGHGFLYQDRRVLVEVISEQLDTVISRYRDLARQGRIELSMTPYAHPIVPLLLDLNCAKEAMPQVRMPMLKQYEGGAERVRWHVQKGLETFEHFFGIRPQGCWPSEGGVSTDSMPYYAEAGFRWIAGGENVIRNSLGALGRKEEPIHRVFALDDSSVCCFFRDDGLSDLVGFTYATWHADDAVANLVHHLKNIAQVQQSNLHNSVVSIVLDGENAWEYYPENGYYFLSALYEQLGSDPEFELTTFGACLDQGVEPVRVARWVAGSWVYGTFSTWIGDVDKNRAWDMLGEAKACFDQVVQSQRISEERIAAAQKQLAVCEGSDWFWWFGDYNPASTVSDFERLYRMQLVNLYQILGEQPPEYLSHVFAHGGGGELDAGGVMRRGS